MLVHQNQGAFIKDRLILHNILLGQELLRGYNRTKLSSRCVIKVDLKKAYDSLSWSFLLQLLEAYRFPSRLVTWIAVCVCSAKYSLVVNGEHVGCIEGMKGLRQGDPVSPLLFVLVMEYLTRLLQARTAHSPFRYHPGCKQLKIINLCFADDLLLFCQGRVPSVQLIL